MDPLSLPVLKSYWSPYMVDVSLLIFMNLAGALILGLIVGYERSYHGRAAGMRTYGLVCTASAALTVICGFTDVWYGSHGQGIHLFPTADPTRVIQGIVTGIGFLGAGVIMKEGFNISGLTTAASIWSSSAIGVLVGLAFYPAAILLTFMSVFCMVGVSKLEVWLPSRQALHVVMRFRQDYVPREEVLNRVALERGYRIASGTLAIDYQDGRPEWRFVAVAMDKEKGESLSKLAQELTNYEGVETFHLSRARN